MSDAALKILRDHAVSHVEFVGTDEYVVCLCGERFNDPQSAYSDNNRISHPQHQLAVLSETHAVVELPELDPDIGPYFNAGCGAVAHVQDGDVRLHSVDYKVGLRGGVLRSPAKATELAAALLAAARAAEATR